ncbi:MAG TPA: hydroxysqualene dehydroxylase HpnE [Acidobacteriaceae bacterium]|jgi:zeta-carotene desaturase|nr:hydroxysqualene dehydroxylase HpnE [Acidobacteriaceae bacterium]
MPDSATRDPQAPKTVTVVGGGLAGIAAACALADAGHRVHLLERRPYLGGRASSYEHPGTGEVIDNCQHVLIGRCTSLLDLYRRLGVLDSIRWYDRFTFLTPAGPGSKSTASVIEPGSLPAPFHSTLAFLRAPAFSLADKIAIARGLSSFMKGLPPDTSEDFAHWLRRHGQTQTAIDRFWKPVLVSALNEDLDRISVHYAAKVFRESFLLSPQSGRMGIPGIPLSELYGAAIGYLEARGSQVSLRTGVESIAPSENGWLTTTADRSISSDAVILALSFEAMAALLPCLPQNPAATELAASLGQFEHSPITGIHLWFDREITDLEHAVLLDTTIQWMFNKSRLQPSHRGSDGSYLELVVSASKSLVPMQRQAIVDLALRELAMFFPEAATATLLKAAVVKEVRATYSVRPGLDPFRPTPASPWPGIYLAGDWTATGWPATMEGAVRSGYLAAGLFTRSTGLPLDFLAPELRPQGFMRFFSGRTPTRHHHPSS